MKKTLLIAVLSLGVGFFFAEPSNAVHKNFENALTCGNCHTMHNSQGGTDLDGNDGGSLILLRGDVTNRSQIHKFCLQCHASNGDQGDIVFHLNSDFPHTAPKVFIEGQAGAGNSGTAGILDSFAVIGAGGDFSGELDSAWDDIDGYTDYATGRGHSLGYTAVAPPGGDTTLASFSCTSCHDPHGAFNANTLTVNKYRNLRRIPTDSGTVDIALHNLVLSHIGDNTALGPNITDGKSNKWVPAVAPASTQTTVWALYDGVLIGDGGAADQAITNVYAVSAGAATDGISNWCATCHDDWHEDNPGGAGNDASPDWNRHPVDNLLSDGTPDSGAGVTIIDTSEYDPTDTLNSLPLASVAGGSMVAYLVGSAGIPNGPNNADNKVFCLSCHFAHAGPYYDNLRWDYTENIAADGGSMIPGEQSGNQVEVGVGCQVCHNR